MPQPLQLRRTTSATTTPNSQSGAAVLAAGEPAVALATTVTKLWVGDGTANRLLLSTDPTDNPIMLAAFLPLAGGTITGAIVWTGPPTLDTHLVNKEYVDDLVAGLQVFSGAWDVAANDPDLTVVTPVNGQYWIASTGGLAPAGVPGIGGQQVNPGDMVVFQIIPGGGMTLAEADARYVQLGGSTMTGVLLLSASPGTGSNVLQAATKGYVDDAIQALADAGVASDGTYITGDGTSGDPLTLSLVDGGTF
jgi:hypothetical protein